ncbi:MAG: fungal-specific transcription factor domain-containing protein [Benjaminiella poitrasii]|nr:MAG: fungal-specific transcription factor domain-containing protein [Benjaminiella poitrasii]
MFPIVPKRLFYKQFDSSLASPIHSESHLLNPALILMMMAHGAQRQRQQQQQQQQQQNSEEILELEADGYFLQARSLVLDSTADPKLSTVAALLLMSFYESKHNPYPVMFSSMAFQMALDLDLMRDYRGELDFFRNKRSEDGELKELRKRICWGCYALDKLIHMQAGQPWMIRTKDIELDMPLLLPGDNVKEHEILEGFVALLKLLQIAERVLQPASLQQAGQPVIRTHTHDQMAFNTNNDLLHWLRALPSQLQWAPSPPYSAQQMLPSNAMVCHLHVIYNFVELSVLKPYTASNVKLIHQRSAVVATNMTRLITLLSTTHVAWIFSRSLLMNALMEATRFHLRLCSSDENLPLARQARLMFQQSMIAMKQLLTLLILKRATKDIRLMTEFVLALEQAISEADTANLNFFSSAAEEEAAAAAAAAAAGIMPPFVLGNTRYLDEERQQWSKLDYFPNGFITPSPVAAKARGFTMSSTMFVPPVSFEDYDTNHSTMSTTDHMFATRFYQTNKLSSSLDEFLANQHPWQPSATANNTTTTTTRTHASPQKNHQHPTEHQQQQQQPLLINQPQQTDLATFVAQQMQQQGGNPDHNWTNHSTPASSTSNKDTPTQQQQAATMENENLLYTLLTSNQHDRSNNNSPHHQSPRRPSSSPPHETSSSTLTRQNNNNSFVQPYISIGLGIYASAHQHHNDVIRQHLPVNNNNNKVFFYFFQDP